MRAIALVIALMLGGFVGLPFAAERAQEFIAGDHMTADVDKVPTAEVGMVLGTAPSLPPKWKPNPDFVARLDAAASLWQAGKVKYLLVSGNGTEPGRWDETTAMRRGLLARGVPASAIYRDDWGLRTWDSVVRARDVFGLRRLVIVSQRSHVARALFLAQSLGLDAYGLEAKDHFGHQSLYTQIRPYPAAVLAYFDAWRGKLPVLHGTPVVIGVKPAN